MFQRPHHLVQKPTTRELVLVSFQIHFKVVMFKPHLPHEKNSQTIPKNVHSLVPQSLLFLESFESSKTSNWLSHMD